MNGLSVFENTYSLVAHHADKTPDATAIEAPGRHPISYSRLMQNILGMAADLQAAGMQREDRVAIVLPNGPEMAVTLLGVSAAAVCAPLNPGYQIHEFEACLSDLNVKLLITRKDFVSFARFAAENRNIPIAELKKGEQGNEGLYSLAPDAFHQGIPDSRLLPTPAPDDIALVLQTSGTTARPKIVPLTHRNICVSVNDICQSLMLNPGDRCLNMMPQFHIGGFVDLLLAPLASGGCIICTDGFDPEQFLQFLEAYRPTWYQAVPSTLSDLVSYVEKEDIIPIKTSLKFIRSVAAPLSPQMMADLESLFDVPVIQTFGMTEAAPLITTNPLPPGRRKSGSTGPSVGPDMAIMDKTGKLLANGEIGEVVVQGDNVVSGYENNPEANMQSFVGGWFHTGDLGYLDEDGYLFLTGRLKEVINRGGEKISPEEIDELLRVHPAVAEAVSFSVPHKVLGEDIAAAVVIKRKQHVTEKDLIRFAADRLAMFKVPRRIYIVKNIPKGPTGKIQRVGIAKRLDLEGGVLPKKVYVPPRSQVETLMADIWAEILRRDQVGIYDNFFELGGDSLKIVRLFLKIEKKFYITLPLYTIFRFSSVAELSELIEKKDKDPRQRLFASICADGRMPVFWIHCRFEHGNLPLVPITSYWEEAPAKDVKEISIEKMASDCIEQIHTFTVNGSYCLGGFSIGGLIALEMARQLKNCGQEIPFLFLLDPAGFSESDKLNSTAAKIFTYMKVFLNLNPEKKVAYIKRKALNYYMFSNFGIKYMLCRLFFRLKKPLPYILRIFYAGKLFSEATAKYTPQPYGDNTAIYLSTANYGPSKEDWQRICPAAEILPVNTENHIEVITAPWSDGWIKDISEKLMYTGIG
jgi:oxalate---CoA ligase